MRSVVVFPDPFGPRKAVTAPAGIVNVMSRTAVTWPNCFVRRCTATSVMATLL